MISARLRCLLLILGTAAMVSSAPGQTVSRTEALRIAESYLQHRWQASPRNMFHGKDAQGIEVHTPDRDSGRGTPLSKCWRVNAQNIGVAYKWGGNDTPES